MTTHPFQSVFRNTRCLYASTLALAASTLTLHATTIAVPNASFESQSAVGFPFGTNPFLDFWQKNAEPAYFAPIAAAYGIPWYGTAGAFIGTSPNSPNPYTNLVGTQAGYILGFPMVALFQDYDTSAGHEFDGTFEIGKTYDLTLGLFGKPTLAASSTFRLSLYYRDTANTVNDPLGEKTIVNSTGVGYSAATFVNNATPALIDYDVLVGAVLPTDPWAGKHIGILLETVDPIPTGGNWDFDNVRLAATAVPEPASASLLAFGIGGLMMRRSRSRRVE